MTIPSSPKRGRGRPPRLDRAQTVDVALDLLNEAGLEALTMRRLAEAVDAQVGALYRYFATKQDLLTAMAERMLDGCRGPSPRHGDWTARVAEMARLMRQALLRYRDGARVFAGTHATGPNTLGFSDSLIGILREAGLTDDDAARAAMTITFYTIGHTLEEQAATTNPEDAPLLANALDANTFPHLTATQDILVSPDFAAHFEFGLGLLITGLRHHVR